MKTPYSEKLQHPNWQRKRLQILKRDDFRCVMCSDADTMLQIHHTEYKGEPWEVADEKLFTLCKHCHTIVEKKEFTPVFKKCANKIVSKVGTIFVSVFDAEDQLHLYAIDGSTVIGLMMYSGPKLKTLVHFIMDYWLQNDLEHNLVDYKKAS